MGERIIVSLQDFDLEVKDPREPFEMKPALKIIAIENTAEAIAALKWMQAKGKTHVPTGSIDELIDERVRGLRALGVEDVDVAVESATNTLQSVRFFKRVAQTFWSHRVLGHVLSEEELRQMVEIPPYSTK